MTETSSGMDEHAEVKARIQGIGFYQNYGKLCVFYHEMQKVPADVSIRSDHPSTPNTQTHAPRGQAFGIVH